MRIAKVLAKRKLTDANFQAMHGPTVSESTFLGKRFLLLLLTGLFRKKRRHSHHNSLDNDSPLCFTFWAKGSRSKNVFCSLAHKSHFPLRVQFFLLYPFLKKNYLGLLFQSCFLNFAYSSFPFWFCARHLLCPLSLGRRDLRSVLWFEKKRHTSRRQGVKWEKRLIPSIPLV